MGNMTEGITLTKDGKEIHFGEQVHTTKGVLFVARIKRRATKGTRMGLVSVMANQNNKENETMEEPINETRNQVRAQVKPTEGRKLHVNTAHQLLGHMGEQVTRAISKHLGWQIVRSPFKPCAACAREKSRAKP